MLYANQHGLYSIAPDHVCAESVLLRCRIAWVQGGVCAFQAARSDGCVVSSLLVYSCAEGMAAVLAVVDFTFTCHSLCNITSLTTSEYILWLVQHLSHL